MIWFRDADLQTVPSLSSSVVLMFITRHKCVGGRYVKLQAECTATMTQLKVYAIV